jgi:hypothetical protein
MFFLEYWFILFLFYLKYMLSLLYIRTYYIVSSNNRQQQAIYAAAYLMGSEVF